MPVLDRHHDLPSGRIRVRLPHVGDRAAVHAFLEDLGLTAHDLDVRRGLRWAPGERWTVVATHFDGVTERIVGMAAVDLDDGSPTLLADDPDVYSVLASALAKHAAAPPRRLSHSRRA